MHESSHDPDEREPAGTAWFFDTWAPMDGLVFASRRTERARHAGIPFDDGHHTVWLRVPDWHPRPVLRATALRAARAGSGFQTGFHDEAGGEIGFATLGELIDVARQAYRGGGLGPGPGEGFPFEPIGPPPEGLPGFGGDAQTFNLTLIDADDDPGGSLAIARKWLQRMVPDSARATVTHAASGVDTQDVFDWFEVLNRMGVGPEHLHPWPSDKVWEYPCLPFGARPVPRLLQGLLFRIPFPWRQADGPRTVGESLLLTLATRDYLDDATDPSRYFSALFAAAALVAASGRPGHSLPLSRDVDGLLGRAARWLAAQWPRVPPGSPAGIELRKFAMARHAGEQFPPR